MSRPMSSDFSSTIQKRVRLLHQAAAQHDAEGVARALRLGADPNSPPQYRASGEGALHVAIEGDEYNTDDLDTAARKAVVDLLLKAGANVDAADESGRTPLFLAAEHGDIELANLLLDAGADPNGAEGCPPLCALARTKSRHSARILAGNLLAAEADLQAADKDGDTALHHAARKGWPSLIKAFLSAGADVNAVNAQKHTPLLALAHAVTAYKAKVSEGERQCLELLVSASGAALNHGDENGDTALHVLTRGTTPEARELCHALLGYDVDCKQPNAAGHTVDDLHMYESLRCRCCRRQ